MSAQSLPPPDQELQSFFESARADVPDDAVVRDGQRRLRERLYRQTQTGMSLWRWAFVASGVLGAGAAMAMSGDYIREHIFGSKHVAPAPKMVESAPAVVPQVAPEAAQPAVAPAPSPFKSTPRGLTRVPARPAPARPAQASTAPAAAPAPVPAVATPEVAPTPAKPAGPGQLGLAGQVALLERAKAESARGDSSAALETIGSLLHDYPTTSVGPEARLLRVHVWANLGRLYQAVPELEHLIEMPELSHRKVEMLAWLVDLESRQGHCTRAASAQARLAKAGANADVLGQARLRVAGCTAP
jgi:hypothetical protein